MYQQIDNANKIDNTNSESNINYKELDKKLIFIYYKKVYHTIKYKIALLFLPIIALLNSPVFSWSIITLFFIIGLIFGEFKISIFKKLLKPKTKTKNSGIKISYPNPDENTNKMRGYMNLETKIKQAIEETDDKQTICKLYYILDKFGPEVVIVRNNKDFQVNQLFSASMEAIEKYPYLQDTEFLNKIIKIYNSKHNIDKTEENKKHKSNFIENRKARSLNNKLNNEIQSKFKQQVWSLYNEEEEINKQ